MTSLACPACSTALKRGESASSGEVCFTDYLCERCGYRGKSIEMLDDWFLDAAHVANSMARLFSKRELVLNLARERVGGRLHDVARPVMVVWNEHEVLRYLGPHVLTLQDIIERRLPVYASGEDAEPLETVVRRYALPVNVWDVRTGGVCFLAEGCVGPSDLTTGRGKRLGMVDNPRFRCVSFTVEGVEDGQEESLQGRSPRTRSGEAVRDGAEGPDLQG